MSMPVFARRIIELEKKAEVFEAYRYSRIGGIVDVTAPDLPLENCMWADGSLALFDLWPELKAKYEKGGFSGLLLPYNCSDANKAAYPLKWVPDSAKPTGLFVPRLNGLFARYCSGDATRVGAYNIQGVPDITGYISIGFYEGQVGTFGGGGAISTGGSILGMYGGGSAHDPTAGHHGGIIFAASRVSPIYGASAGVMPMSFEAPVALYLGNPAHI